MAVFDDNMLEVESAKPKSLAKHMTFEEFQKALETPDVQSFIEIAADQYGSLESIRDISGVLQGDWPQGTPTDFTYRVFGHLANIESNQQEAVNFYNNTDDWLALAILSKMGLQGNLHVHAGKPYDETKNQVIHLGDKISISDKQEHMQGKDVDQSETEVKLKGHEHAPMQEKTGPAQGQGNFGF